MVGKHTLNAKNFETLAELLLAVSDGNAVIQARAAAMGEET